MILILTYHKVLRSAETKPEFYSIKAETLERHLQLLAQSGFRALQPEELLSCQPDTKPAYLLTFDDGTRDHYEVVLPLLARYSFVPPKAFTFFSNSRTRLSRSGNCCSAMIWRLACRSSTAG